MFITIKQVLYRNSTALLVVLLHQRTNNSKMTEYWKSNPMHWCDICKCWMQDTKAAKLNHERGLKHKDGLARKLREMGRKAEDEKRQEKAANFMLSKLDEAAQKQYEEDLLEAEESAGLWLWNSEAKLYYNARHRWYYDPKNNWYYGGDPPEWTQLPAIPSPALFENARHMLGPGPSPNLSKAKPSGAPSGLTIGSAAGGATGQHVVRKKVIEVPSHPLMAVGGHQAPLTGKVGAAKGIGAQSGVGDKRKLEGAAGAGRGKAISKEEEEAQARREAARARVAARTASSFGYQ